MWISARSPCCKDDYLAGSHDLRGFLRHGQHRGYLFPGRFIGGLDDELTDRLTNLVWSEGQVTSGGESSSLGHTAGGIGALPSSPLGIGAGENRTRREEAATMWDE